MKQIKYKPNKILTNEELEVKIMGKYNKANPQPQNLKERVEERLNKLNK